jgi:signal peptidase I
MLGRTMKIILAIVLLGFGSLFGYYLIFLRMVRVPSGAMSNTVIPGDQLVVNKRVGKIERGDLLIFKFPKNPSELHVSRAIGLPGETIEIRGTVIYINGKQLPEQRVTVRPEPNGSFAALEELSTEGAGAYRVFYHPRGPENEQLLSEDLPDESYGLRASFQIPDNQYFVMSDNRDNSYDSRFWGTVSREAIVGKPTMIYWSSHLNHSGVEEVRWERLFTSIK